MRIVIVTNLLAMLAAGCGSQPRHGDPTLLDFIMDGETVRTEVLLNLGQPSASFEKEGILTYRIGGNERKGYFLREQTDSWNETRFSLVLVFDDAGKLVTHSLVRVR